MRGSRATGPADLDPPYDRALGLGMGVGLGSGRVWAVVQDANLPKILVGVALWSGVANRGVRFS